MYIWQKSAWPHFTWDAKALLGPLAAARHQQGVLLGRMLQLGFDMQGAAQVQALTEEVVKTSAIEGEMLDADQVRSSVARRLGVPLGGLAHPIDQKTEGAVEMMLDATQHFEKVLTLERLLAWQAALFPTGISALQRIATGTLRDDLLGPMQVVSGRIGKEKVHYEAPPAVKLPGELKGFLKWFNDPVEGDGLIRAGIAHFWFVTIHPFDDGNGRVARAVADLALAQLEGSGRRFYSMSGQIRAERKAYYEVLERTQKGPLDITPWLTWFLRCFTRAIETAQDVCGDVLARAALARRLSHETLNERQQLVMGTLLGGLEGVLTARRWAVMAKCSPDSAQRDIKELLELDLIRKNSGGSKNTSYGLALDMRKSARP